MEIKKEGKTKAADRGKSAALVVFHKKYLQSKPFIRNDYLLVYKVMYSYSIVFEL